MKYLKPIRSGIAALLMVAWAVFVAFNYTSILRLLHGVFRGLDAWIERIAPVPKAFVPMTDLDVALFFAGVLIFVVLFSVALKQTVRHRDSKNT